VLWDETDELRKTFPDDSQTFSAARLTAHNGGVHVEGWLVEYAMTIAGLQLAYARFAADFSAGGNVVTRIGERFRRAPRPGPALRQSVSTELGIGARDADSPQQHRRLSVRLARRSNDLSHLLLELRRLAQRAWGLTREPLHMTRCIGSIGVANTAGRADLARSSCRTRVSGQPARA
jgi:hypothetical protein